MNEREEARYRLADFAFLCTENTKRRYSGCVQLLVFVFFSSDELKNNNNINK